ncbi:MAG: CCE_0567 family metalloprotein [Methylohalobius sp.]
MAEPEDLKARLKKLSAQATALKMDLHDLAEDLPTGWERIMEVAEKTYRAYQELDALRKQLAESVRSRL